MKMWSRENNLLIFIFILVALEAILFFSGNFELNKKQRIETQRKIEIKNSFDSIPILAKSFSIYDVSERKEIYNRNGDETLPLASLSKILTSIIALEKYNINDVVMVSKKSFGDNANNSLSLNEKWKMEDLIKFTLISSSNSGALSLVQDDQNFLNEMNKKAKIIGMKDSSFFNFTGLDLDKNNAGAYGRAIDVNLLAVYAIENYPNIFEVTTFSNMVFKSKSGYVHKVKNTNTVVGEIPNLIFSKTGFTSLAGGNLTVMFKNKLKHNIVITLLGSTETGRFSDMTKLVAITNNLNF